jgi:hypothetical protein
MGYKPEEGEYEEALPMIQDLIEIQQLMAEQGFDISEIFQQGGKVFRHQDNEMNPNLIYDDNVGYMRTIGGRRIPVNFDIMGAEQRQNYRNYKNYIDYLNQQSGGAEIKTGDDFRKAYRQQSELLYQGGGRIKLDLEKKLGVDIDKLDPLPIGTSYKSRRFFQENPLAAIAYGKNPLAVAALGKNPFRVAGSPPKDLLG